MCIPERYSKECAKMMEDSANKGFPIACISGRDRYECIERVGKKEADIVAVDPEDMYLAAKNKLAEKAGYNVVEQVSRVPRKLNLSFDSSSIKDPYLMLILL